MLIYAHVVPALSTHESRCCCTCHSGSTAAVACRVLQLSAIQYFILDEADEMLNMGFQEDVEEVLESVPDSRQTMMFSATMPQWVRKLARKYCQDYIMVDLVGEHDSGVHLATAQSSKMHDAT